MLSSSSNRSLVLISIQPSFARCKTDLSSLPLLSADRRSELTTALISFTRDALNLTSVGLTSVFNPPNLTLVQSFLIHDGTGLFLVPISSTRFVPDFISILKSFARRVKAPSAKSAIPGQLKYTLSKPSMERASNW